MALNENYSGFKKGNGTGGGNFSKEDKRPQSYSMYTSMYNMGGVDPSRLSIDYFSNVLKFSIAPMIKDAPAVEGGMPSFDYTNAISIFLRQNEARIFKNEILNFMKDPVAFNNSGVVTRSGIVTVGNGKEYGANGPCIVVRKVDENGKVISTYLYECNVELMYSIRNYNDKKDTFDKVTLDYQYTELLHIIEHLDAYLAATTNAVAHTVLDNSRFMNSRMNTKIDAIAAAMNIRFDGGNKGGYNGGGQSHFNKAPATNYSSSNYNSGSYDDLNTAIDD